MVKNARWWLPATVGLLGLRFYFNERDKREWMTDGSLDWLWPGRTGRRADGARGRVDDANHT